MAMIYDMNTGKRVYADALEEQRKRQRDEITQLPLRDVIRLLVEAKYQCFHSIPNLQSVPEFLILGNLIDRIEEIQNAHDERTSE